MNSFIITAKKKCVWNAFEILNDVRKNVKCAYPFNMVLAVLIHIVHRISHTMSKCESPGERKFVANFWWCCAHFSNGKGNKKNRHVLYILWKQLYFPSSMFVLIIFKCKNRSSFIAHKCHHSYNNYCM